MTIVRLSDEDLSHLFTVKENGRQRGRVSEKTLFDLFHMICQIKHLKYFHTGWFRSEWSSCGSNHGEGIHWDVSAVLSRGEISRCIRYGNLNNFFDDVSTYRWGWKEL